MTALKIHENSIWNICQALRFLCWLFLSFSCSKCKSSKFNSQSIQLKVTEFFPPRCPKTKTSRLLCSNQRRQTEVNIGKQTAQCTQGSRARTGWPFLLSAPGLVGRGSRVPTSGWACTYWLEQVDERFLLDDYHWQRSDASRLEQGAHRCHDLVKAPSESSQRHYHIHLSKAK